MVYGGEGGGNVTIDSGYFADVPSFFHPSGGDPYGSIYYATGLGSGGGGNASAASALS